MPRFYSDLFTTNGQKYRNSLNVIPIIYIYIYIYIYIFRIGKLEIWNHKTIKWHRSILLSRRILFFFSSSSRNHILDFIQYACSSVISIHNLMFDVSKSIQINWGYLVFHFLRFLQAGYHAACLHDLSMLVAWFWIVLWHLESRRCCGCLANSTPRSVASDAFDAKPHQSHHVYIR